MILSIFYLQVAPILPTKFAVNLPFGSGVQNRFSRWPPPLFSIRIILAIFALQATMILPTKFRVSWSFSSGDKGQNDFSYF